MLNPELYNRLCAVFGEVHVWNVDTGAVARPVRTSWAGLDPATLVTPELPQPVRLTLASSHSKGNLVFLIYNVQKS